jgi:hypothetical protein
MLKKFMLIGFLFISVMVMLPTQATAWSISSGGFGWGTYTGTFKLSGGGPDKEGNYAIFKGTYRPVNVVLWQFNPKGQDVRVGIGGLKPITAVNPDTSFKVDQNGNFFVDQVLLSRTPEFAKAICDQNYLDGAYSMLYKKYEDNNLDLCNTDIIENPYEFCTENPTDPICAPAVAELMYFWGLTDEDLRNKNWTAYEPLITDVEFTGTIYSKCDLPDDPNTCQKEADVKNLACTTGEDPRYWPGEDGVVIFICEDVTP